MNLRKNNLIRHFLSFLPYRILRKDVEWFDKTTTLIKETEAYTIEQIKDWQYKKLKFIIEYAWNNIGGYRTLWKEAGFNPSLLGSLEDISMIPFVTKETLRDNLKEFSNINFPNLQYVTTGGSTGIPFGFYRQRHNDMVEWAFIINMWRRFYKDMSLDTKRVFLRGNRLEKSYYNDPLNGLFLSAYDLDLFNVKLYIEQIEKTRYSILHAYPSALYLMSKIMKDNGLTISYKFKSIMLASEPLYDFQKELISDVFNTKISNFYGHSEHTILAGNFPYDNRFYCYPQYGITEIIDVNNNVITSGEGELVGTSFWNYATPFIRYKTADYASISQNDSSPYYPLLDRIKGRLQEFIVTKDKKLISMTAINMHDDIFDSLQQFRFVQEKIGEVYFTFLPKENQQNIDIFKIRRGLEDKLGSSINLTLQEVREIPRTKSGKLRFLDQKLDINEFK